MEEITIKKSNFKIIFILTAAIIFGIICFRMFVYPDRYLSFIFRSETFIKFFGLIGLIFIAICTIFILNTYIKNKFGLVINNNGIIDNSSVASVGLIEWKDIKGIEKRDVLSTSFLVVELYDTDKYIKKKSNPLLLFLRKLALRKYGTPITISNKALDYNFNDLYTIIEERYHLYLNKGNVSD